MKYLEMIRLSATAQHSGDRHHRDPKARSHTSQLNYVYGPDSSQPALSCHEGEPPDARQNSDQHRRFWFPHSR